jgi:hypothetical protein
MAGTELHPAASCNDSREYELYSIFPPASDHTCPYLDGL